MISVIMFYKFEIVRNYAQTMATEEDRGRFNARHVIEHSLF